MTDDHETIRRGLTDVWASQGRRFVTFEPSHERGGDTGAAPWVQFLDGEVNASWPMDEEPALALARCGVALPATAFVSWHCAGSNAVFGMGDASVDDVARFVAALLARVLGVRPGAPLVARVDEHR